MAMNERITSFADNEIDLGTELKLVTFLICVILSFLRTRVGYLLNKRKINKLCGEVGFSNSVLKH